MGERALARMEKAAQKIKDPVQRSRVIGLAKRKIRALVRKKKLSQAAQPPKKKKTVSKMPPIPSWSSAPKSHSSKKMSKKTLEGRALARMEKAAQGIHDPAQRARVIALARKKIRALVRQRQAASPAPAPAPAPRSPKKKTHSAKKKKPKQVKLGEHIWTVGNNEGNNDPLASLAMAKMTVAAQKIKSKTKRHQVIKLAKERILKDVAKRTAHKAKKPVTVKSDALANMAMARMTVAAQRIKSKKERAQVVALAKERILKDVAKRITKKKKSAASKTLNRVLKNVVKVAKRAHVPQKKNK